MAAGLGFKDFTTGEVLTAADVDGYLMQGVWVFASAAARDAAVTSPQEGNFAYLKDTNVTTYYTGSAWTALDTQGIPASAFTTKGDLLVGTGSGTYDDLTVGANGQTLVADSSTTTGLAYIANYAAGKNRILNGDFRINQRAFTSTTTNAIYTFDRFRTRIAGDGTSTFSAQTFAAGANPVAGEEGANYLRVVTTGQTTVGTITAIEQPIEDLRPIAGKTVTVSFYAKADSGTPSISVGGQQRPDASAIVNITPVKKTITTSWARYSFTLTIPEADAGWTYTTFNQHVLRIFLSAGSDFNAQTSTLGIQSNTFEIWGVQLEAGSTATAFQTATGTIQGELAACQRYYFRQTAGAAGQHFSNGNNESTTKAVFVMPFPTIMRIAPTALEQSGTAGDYSVRHQATSTTASVVPAFESASTYAGIFTTTVASGLTAGNGSFSRPVNSSAYLGWSAEL